MATDTPDAPFVASDLVGSAGIGSEAERLIATLALHVPPELEAVQLRRINESLTAQAFGGGIAIADAGDDDKKRWKTANDNVAKIAGAERIEYAVVRGGERNSDDAWVSYVYLDHRGVDVKGAFPYSDLSSGKSDKHVSQRDSVMRSPAARDHAAAQAKAENAPASDEVARLREQIEALSERLDQDPGDPEPVKDYGKANAADIATMLGTADRATVVRVLEYEQAHKERSTVTDAATKRIEALDEADREAEAERQALADRNAELEARIAELEAAQSAAGDGDPPKP